MPQRCSGQLIDRQILEAAPGGIAVEHQRRTHRLPQQQTVIGVCEVEAGTIRETSRVRSLTPELPKRLEFDLVVLIDPETFGNGIEGTVDRYVAMTRATNNSSFSEVTPVVAK